MTAPVSHANAFVFGRNSYGCLGLGDDVPYVKYIRNPRKLNANDGCGWTQIACVAWHTVALSHNGDIFTWGCGDVGQLGHGDGKNRNVPTKVESLSRETIVKVACGLFHTAVVTSTGKLLTWYVP